MKTNKLTHKHTQTNGISGKQNRIFHHLGLRLNQIGIGINASPPTPTEATEDLIALMESMASEVQLLKDQRTDLLTTVSTLETRA